MKTNSKLNKEIKFLIDDKFLVDDKEKSPVEEKFYFSLMDATSAINYMNGIIDYEEYLSGVEDYTEPLVPEYEVIDDKEK